MTEKKKAHLVWKCRRGMLELDLILQQVLNKGLHTMSDQQLVLFDQLLENTDPELYTWLMGYEEPLDKGLREIVSYIRTQY
ncbi:succinate dehydrogenase assembly factor 2 [Legionella waltersii]|uniref:FAD assembly factor SdhE n=1 Tax=Legionella waltersii TaxID=66969 RepID=UPI00187D836A|nr:succinate dehydrogenase assembly factor 2 [Legionella waltersii]